MTAVTAVVQNRALYEKYRELHTVIYSYITAVQNRALYEKYRELAEKEEGVCFVGRLASYKYFNMDQVRGTRY